MQIVWYIVAVAALVFGFGFVVFFHELGHFLAAKWVGIKVEQFAIGFGPAIAAWRKGMGFRLGNTAKEYEQRLRDYLSSKQQDGTPPAEPPNELTPAQMVLASNGLGLGETEYRFNWVPLGGYVKMLGQDDMNPNAQADDPRAYNRKSVGARMVVVSAGVIMNVILAAILFMALFLMGFHAPPAMVGSMFTDSPAQEAGLQVGDRFVSFNGQVQHDFNKLLLSIALAPADRPVSVTVRRGDSTFTTEIRPLRAAHDSKSFLALGIQPMFDLKGWPAKDREKFDEAAAESGVPVDPKTMILPGDVIIKVNGQDVSPTDYPVLDKALQASFGRPVELTVRQADGTLRTVTIHPRFEFFFGESPENIAGMEPLAQVDSVLPNSTAQGKLESGDVVVAVQAGPGAPVRLPTLRLFVDTLREAGERGEKNVALTVIRNGEELPPIEGLEPNIKVESRKRGLGIGTSLAEHLPMVANVIEGTPAQKAGIPRGATILSIDNQPVSSWFDVQRLLLASKGTAHVVIRKQDEQQPATVTMRLDKADLAVLSRIRYRPNLTLPSQVSMLAEHMEVRKTSNPLTAAAWGVTETRDLLLQFYVTLRRVFQGSVSATNFVGPIGIVHMGSMFAFRGWDWLTWFLAMISANLAVVNFLPIPIVDGGLFLFLILEKIIGKPPSPRVQTVAQLLGLAIILSVFVLVTYQDIARIFL